MKNLIKLVQNKHSSQKRKYTGEEYFVHLESVAGMVEEKLIDKKLVAIAYCHDLFEDTDCSEEELREVLGTEEYSKSEIEYILEGVHALSDVYTSKSYPELNRGKRKERENDRLSKIKAEFQSIKYCDILDNLNSIMKYDAEGFGKIYCEEMKKLLEIMNKGDGELYRKVVGEIG